MSVVKSASLAIVAASIAAVGLSMGSASAQTISEPTCPEVSIRLNPVDTTVVGGTTVTINAQVSSNIESHPLGTLRLTVLGKTYSVASDVKSVTVKTPVVTKKTPTPVVAAFTPTDDCVVTPASSTTTEPDSSVAPANYVIAADSGRVQPAVAYLNPVNATGTLTLLPVGSNNGGANGALPNTGGTNLWYIVAGAVLLAAGVAVVGVVNSRRSKKLL